MQREADEDCGEILQACARARLGGARRRNWVLLKYTTTGRRHVHLAASDSCGDCWPSLTLTPFLAHFSFLSIFFSIFFLFITFFFAFFSSFFHVLSFYFFLSIFFSSLSPFFQVSQSWSFCKLGYSLNRTCSDFPTNFPHT